MANKKQVKSNNKNVNKKVSSYARKTKTEKVSSHTKQQQFDFGSELDDIENLDVSFMDTSSKKKSIDSLKEADLTYKSKKTGLIVSYLLLIIAFCVVFSILVIHFLTYDHVSRECICEKKVVVDDNYLFLGDSITDFYDLEKYYGDLPVVNSGISGDKTDDILNNMKDRVYVYNPSKVFILIGTNDLAERGKSLVIDNIKKIVLEIKKNRPYCEIYLESIYPINLDEKYDDLQVYQCNKTNDLIREVNDELEKFAADENLVFIDFYTILSDEDGNLNEKYTYDGLHLSDDGYFKVTEVIKEYIDK